MQTKNKTRQQNSIETQTVASTLHHCIVSIQLVYGKIVQGTEKKLATLSFKW